MSSERDHQQLQKQQHREQDQIEWRRSQVLELSSQGQTERQIATILQVGKTTVHKDLAYLSRQAKPNLKVHILDRLPEEYQKCMVGINQVLNMAWSIANKEIDNKTKLQALALINDCNRYKMDLATGSAICNEAIKFVTQKQEQINTLQNLDERIEAIEEEGEKTTSEVF